MERSRRTRPDRCRFGATAAVDHVDLAVPAGSVVAVLGPSGCGKSTLLRAVAGLEVPASGTVSYDGHDLAGTPTHRRGFALMFQDGQLFEHLDVAANIAYPLRLRHRSRADQREAGTRAARSGRPRGVRRPAARHAVRRRAPAGRTRPGARRRAPAAAARRAAQRPRPWPARTARRRAPRHPPRRRGDRDAGDPRPRGGLRRRRPDGRDARGSHRPGRHPRGGLEPSRRRVDGGVPGLRDRAHRGPRRPAARAGRAG